MKKSSAKTILGKIMNTVSIYNISFLGLYNLIEKRKNTKQMEKVINPFNNASINIYK